MIKHISGELQYTHENYVNYSIYIYMFHMFPYDS